MKNKKRDINMELLRILAMILVVTCHAIQHSGILENLHISNVNFIGIGLIKIIASMCNVCFILITGYYMIDAKFKIKKILSLWAITIFYSIIICCIMDFVLKEEVYCNKSISPILTSSYWFITSYIALYFISPILNMTIKKMTKNQFQYVLIIMTIIYGVISIFWGTLSYELGNMIYVYMIGAYIKRYVKIKEENGNYLLRCFAAILLVGVIKLVIIQFSGEIRNEIMQDIVCRIFEGLGRFTNPIIIYASICLFMKFATMKIKNEGIEKITKLIVPSILYVYIIHENINMRPYLWNKIFNFKEYASSGGLILYMVSAIIFVFIACIIIDLTRRGIYYLLKKIPLINNAIEKLKIKLEFIDKKMETIFTIQEVDKKAQNILNS